jgi:transposase
MFSNVLTKPGSLWLLSNVNLTADKMIKVARMRDSNEKTFRRIKNHFGLSKTYSHSAATYEGKMFIAFVALIIIESYRYYIKPVLNAISSTTTSTTIGELNKYQIQQKRDGSWMPMYAITKKQRQIFKCLDLTEGKIKTMVSNIRV